MDTPHPRDRMAGRYFSQCPSCRTGRTLGPCCGGGGPIPAKLQRTREKAALRRWLCEGDDMLEPGKVDLDAVYTATIKPWDNGWEIAIDGPGIADGATQACTLGEVKLMAQDYILTASDYPEDDDLWESACAAVKVELVLDLGAPHVFSRSAVIETLRDGEKVVVVEEVTSWVEDPEAE